jgi:hypothetical protein
MGSGSALTFGMEQWNGVIGESELILRIWSQGVLDLGNWYDLYIENIRLINIKYYQHIYLSHIFLIQNTPTNLLLALANYFAASSPPTNSSTPLLTPSITLPTNSSSTTPSPQQKFTLISPVPPVTTLTQIAAPIGFGH